MKKFLVSVLLILSFATYALADMPKTQEQKEPATKIEAFLSRKGEMLVKDFYKLGSHFYPHNMTLTAIVIYKPGQEGQRMKGMKIEIDEGGKFERSNAAFLDVDEVESLLKALSYLEGLAEKMKSAEREYTEVVFTTRGDFSIGFYKNKNEMSSFASSGFIGKTTTFFSIDELRIVKATVEKGLNLLKEK